MNKDKGEDEDNNQLITNLEKFNKMKGCYPSKRLNKTKNYLDFTMYVKVKFGECGKPIWDEICKKCNDYSE